MNDKINFNGYYYTKRSNRENLYGIKDYSSWCRNHTFVPHEINGDIYMVDTFWGGRSINGNSKKVKVTEENLKYFELQVDISKVKEIKDSERSQYKYEDIISVVTGDVGSSRVTHYVDTNLNKDVYRTLEMINSKIDDLNRQLQNALDLKRQIAETGEVPKYFYI